MKIPRDLSGAELVKRLARLGYATTRQSGTHIRLTSTVQGEHHITLPKEALNKSTFVIPAKAGIQLNQASGPRLSPG